VEKFQLDLKFKIGGLSTGQKRRVQITVALASRPKILIIDEITAVLDPDARKIFFDLLQNVNSNYGTAIILATNIVEDLKDKVKDVFFICDHSILKYSPDKIETLFTGEK
jgi:ABC-2 type transport system ATP-binding protein